MNHKIIIGDTLHILKKFSSESVNCIITSPPYWGLRDYGPETNTIFGGDFNCEHEWIEEEMTLAHKKQNFGKGIQEKFSKEQHTSFPKKYDYMSSSFCCKCGAWYGQLGLEPIMEMYLEHILAITKELHRVLRKDGVLFWNHGDCYGGSGVTKSAYKKNNKRSISIPDLYADMPSSKSQVMPKCLALQQYRLILRMIDEQGWILRNIIIWSKPNHMPSSVKDRFANAYEPVFMLVKNKKYWFDLDAARKPYSYPNDVVRRMRQDKKAGVKPSQKGNPISSHTKQDYVRQRVDSFEDPLHSKPIIPLGKNPGNIWTIPSRPFPEAHFAVFPEKLVEPMIKCGCPKEICSKCGKPRERIVKGTSQNAFNIRVRDVKEARMKHSDRKASEREIEKYKEGKTHAGIGRHTVGWTKCNCQKKFTPGIVLDPFLGSGTTMAVAERLGVNCIGIELNPNYVQIAKKRIELALCRSNSRTELKIINNKIANGPKEKQYKPDNLALTQ